MPAQDPPPSTAPSSLVEESESSPNEGGETCLNCGHSVVEGYCAACGQKAEPLRQPIHHFLASAIVEYFGIDGRLWASLKLLLIHPGRLTQEYLKGRRVRYLRPLRLYLSATLLFFFLLTVIDPSAQLEGAVGEQDIEVDSVATAAERLASVDASLAAFDEQVARASTLVDSLAREGVLQVDSVGGEVGNLTVDLVQGGLDSDERRLIELVHQSRQQRERRRLLWQRDALTGMASDSVVNVYDWTRAGELVIPGGGMNIDLPDWMPRSRSIQRLETARTSDARAAAFADYVREIIGKVPTVMFLLLPVFALLLKLIYLRRGWFYSEHLVFALHTHAFAFIVFTVMTVVLAVGGARPGTEWLALLLFAGLPLYFFVAQKRVYEQGWVKTAAKAVFLGVLYGSFMLVGVLGALLLASAV